MITLLKDKPVYFLRRIRWESLKSIVDNMGWEYL